MDVPKELWKLYEYVSQVLVLYVDISDKRILYLAVYIEDKTETNEYLNNCSIRESFIS